MSLLQSSNLGNSTQGDETTIAAVKDTYMLQVVLLFSRVNISLFNVISILSTLPQF